MTLTTKTSGISSISPEWTPGRAHLFQAYLNNQSAKG